MKTIQIKNSKRAAKFLRSIGIPEQDIEKMLGQAVTIRKSGFIHLRSVRRLRLIGQWLIDSIFERRSLWR